MMHKAEFEVQTVTPLFIAGADQEDISNEALRPPSLRGVMRWWYRTLLLAKTDSLETINEHESDLFGSTNRKSPISIIQGNFLGPNIATYSKQWSFDIDYLFFSFRQTRDRSARRFYDVDTTFSLTLLAKKVEKLERAISIFWLALNLGSIGSRARRGAGSLSLVKAEFKSSEPLISTDMIINSNSYSDYQKYLSTNLKKICNTSQINFAEFNRIAEIWVKNQEFDDWRKALIEGSRWLKQEKDRLKNSYGGDQRPYLGMPRKGFDIPNENYKRRASPMWLAVAKSSSNKYFLRMVILKSEFLPEFGGRFSFKGRKYNAKNYHEILSDIAKGLRSSGWVAIKW
ncbi:MAG TPA: type III-B CRISPR module RAMP protein Cmr1 [Nitrososphaera sp.]|nr:type III-B CRISPR module RAMP protein Cmr1 [Nitrososphaera sp.]